MADMTPAERQALAASLTRWLHQKIRDQGNDVEYELSAGVTADYTEDLLEPQVSQNGSATLTVRINGGARHNQLS